ncbi:MAG: thioesterase [Bdellovibrionaceae bacterium]|nr:thioesterase [Bdellovibrionales bacterium]MCB9084256.1 thioesterase [Pseudobdellovibrionaceae bacterium]
MPSTNWDQAEEDVVHELPDGDKIVSHLRPGQTDLMVYLFHGLGGCGQSPYMQRMAQMIQQEGHGVMVTNHRGSGPGEGLAKKPYHSGVAEDLSTVLYYGRQRFPHCRHLAIGFSLSANALLLLLSGAQGGVLPDYAIAINAPINLERTSLLLQTGFNRVYDLHFVRLMRQRMAEKVKRGFIHPYQYKVTWLNTLREFDSIYLAPEAGFRNRLHYYESCSTHDKLSHVDVPTVVLTAEDDPFIDVRDYVNANMSPAIHLHIERHGGHMGYLHHSNLANQGRRWMDFALGEYIRAFFLHRNRDVLRQDKTDHSKGTSTRPFL